MNPDDNYIIIMPLVLDFWNSLKSLITQINEEITLIEVIETLYLCNRL